MRHFMTTEKDKFVENVIYETDKKKVTLQITDEENRLFEGFGSCFNELGFKALLNLEESDREKLLDQLFLPQHDLNFTLCRLPIGASDYALSWYSFDEVDEDFDLEHFSIERDKELLIPYIKAALQRNPNLVLVASPWSPPTWMKTMKAYNFGTLRWEESVLKAYANYFVKFVKAYAEEGIVIQQVHVQNEVVADQKFPSCRWTGVELRDFIKNYLGPAFEKNEIEAEIWLGTINAPEANTEMIENRTEDYDVYAATVLRDSKAYQYTSGVGYQWAGKNAIQQTVESFPEKRFLQTENECGNGENKWTYAEYVYSLYRLYLVNGVNGYIYWNAVLEPGGMSTWGWKQNSMITVVPESKEVILNPEYYVVKHFSHFIQKGAFRLTTKGMDTGIATAFKNPDGEIIITLCNKMADELLVVVEVQNQCFELVLPPHSFHTLVK